MTVPSKYGLIAWVSAAALLLSACGANQATIATSVAATLQAEHTQEAAQWTATPEPVRTLTPAASTEPVASSGPLSTKAPPTAPPTGVGQFCTATASFVSETIPDGTILSPGQVFTKTWRIKNSGTCPWNNTWKFIYISGDILGGSATYPFPQVAMPGDTVDVSLTLTAPKDGGSYRGYWKMQSPWGYVFGDSGSGNPFWVDINVGSGTPANNKTQTAYGVTSVTYETDPSVIRRCTTANTFYHYIAYITSNGPLKVSYQWMQSDGNNSNKGSITFDKAETKSVSGDWSQKIGSGKGDRWVQLVITDPTYHEYPQFTLPALCW